MEILNTYVSQEDITHHQIFINIKILDPKSAWVQGGIKEACVH